MREAYHESGHAVAALLLLSGTMTTASVVPNADSAGRVRFAGFDEESRLDVMTVWCAGAEAERYFLGAAGDGDRNDRAVVKALSNSEQEIAEARALAAGLIRIHAPWIRRVAAALERRRTLTAHQVAKLRGTS
jgi:hypothetical protein